jgi:hypothetical protein
MPAPATSADSAAAARRAGASSSIIIAALLVATVAAVTTVTAVGAAVSAASSSGWRPAPGTTWQWLLSRPLRTSDMSLPVAMFDIDGVDNSAATVAALHARGKRAVCYVEVGGWESYRPDAAAFPRSMLGQPIDGWPQERWIDVRQLDVLAPVLHARFTSCRDKGFDAVEPDVMDGYANDTGFPLTPGDQIAFNRWVAADVHALGMAVAQKNAPELAADLVASFDFVIVEQCAAYGECSAYAPYVAAGKAVLDVEYTGSTGFCAQLPPGFSGMAKRLSLDAWRLPCPAGKTSSKPR